MGRGVTRGRGGVEGRKCQGAPLLGRSLKRAWAPSRAHDDEYAPPVPAAGHAPDTDLRLTLRRAATWSGLCALPFVIARVVEVPELAKTVALADLTGLLADFGVGALLATVLLVIARLERRWLRFGLGAAWLLVWSALVQGNYEHIKTLGNVMSGFYAEFLTNPTFLWGSALDLSRPALLLLNIAATWFFWFRLSRTPVKGRAPLASLALGAALSLLSVALPTSGKASQWRQRNFVLENIRWAAFSEELVPLDVELAGMFPKDLDGEPRSRTWGQEPNVLLIVLEGVSGAYVDPVADYQELAGPRPRLESLSQLATEGLTYANFLNHQRQTNRGLYTILCGDLPKLVTQAPKMTELGWGQSPLPCLPNELAALGYETLFIQAAPLGFMSKDRFMPRAGFTRVLGDEFFRRKKSSTGKWGVDDREFFKQSVPLVEQLAAADRPWLMTMLTSGTHHPFNVPATFKSDYEPKTFANAVAYLDTALGEFIGTLRKKGLLENTIIVITSDESFGLERPESAAELALSQAWGTLTIIAPGQAPELVTETFHQSDVALTILDALGVADQARAIGGRSALRRYATRRATAFGNTYLRTLFGFDGEETLYSCTESFTDCRGYTVDPTHMFAPLGSELSASPEQVEFVKTFAGRSLVVASHPEDESTWALVTRPNPIDPKTLPKKKNGFRELFGNQYISLEKGDALVIDVELELDDPQAFSAFHALWAVPRDKMPSGARFRADLENEAARLRLGDSTLGMRPRFAPWADTFIKESYDIQPGGTLRIHYELRASEALERVDARLNVKVPNGAKLVVERATLEIQRESKGKRGITKRDGMSEPRPRG